MMREASDWVLSLRDWHGLGTAASGSVLQKRVHLLNEHGSGVSEVPAVERLVVIHL